MAKSINRTIPSERTATKGALTAPKYSSKIIKAGALLSDTKALLSAWDPDLTVSENLHRVRRQNLLGKSSRSRAEDILAIFRQRYLAEDAVVRSLATMVRHQSNSNTLDRILYYHAVHADFADKLRRAADLHLDPDLNDGVVLNIAPLWELVPWNEPKKYWEELQEGKYDWSHIALQLWPERVKELCRKDRSIAIAHDLEAICEVGTGGNHAG